MRGKITDQDLTNYALNDGLDPRERLYIESILAVSEECRNDVYRIIDVGQMLEAGFQREATKVAPGLTAEQRLKLLQPRERRFAKRFLSRATATLALAACVAFAIANPQFWRESAPGRKVAEVSQMMAGTNAPGQDVDFASLVDLHTLVDDSSLWLQTATDAAPQPASMVCTPPSWLENSDFGDGQ